MDHVEPLSKPFLGHDSTLDEGNAHRPIDNTDMELPRILHELSQLKLVGIPAITVVANESFYPVKSVTVNQAEIKYLTCVK